MLLLCYPKCSTCKKAQKWLEAQGISYTYRDIREENPTALELERWLALSGKETKALFNTSGQRYRELSLKDRLPAMDTKEQLALLAEDGMLVKRPILVGENFALIGFRQGEWEQALL